MSSKIVQSDIERACNDISRFAVKFLDEMNNRRVHAKYMKGWCGSIMASFALYKAREEIITKRKKHWMGDVWPKEM